MGNGAVPSQEFSAASGYTLYDDVIVQIDDFLVLMDEQREIKSHEVQLLKQRNRWAKAYGSGLCGTYKSALLSPSAEWNTAG